MTSTDKKDIHHIFHEWHFYPWIRYFHPWMFFMNEKFIHGLNLFIHGCNLYLSCFWVKIGEKLYYPDETKLSFENTRHRIFTQKCNKLRFHPWKKWFYPWIKFHLSKNFYEWKNLILLCTWMQPKLRVSQWDYSKISTFLILCCLLKKNHGLILQRF